MKTNKTNQKNMIIYDGIPFINVIETKFDTILPDLPQVDQVRIEKKILSDGLQIPLTLGKVKTNQIRYELVTGFFEYQIVKKHNLPFSVIVRNFDSDDDVIKYIITGILNRLHLTLFQKCELVLKHQDSLMKKGKENMILGGKGSKIPEKDKIDTMVQLAAMIGTSHDTLRKVRYILNELEDDNLLNKLRSGDISINKVHEELTGKKKTQIIVEQNQATFFPDFNGIEDSGKIVLEYKPINEFSMHSQFHIDDHDQYPIIYIKPKMDLTSATILHDPYLEELQKMNISELVHDKFGVLFFQTTSRYLTETIKIIESWKFKCVDSFCVSTTSKIYSSSYSDQNHEFLLVCEFKEVEIPKSFIINRPTSSIINSDNVMNTINGMFNKNLSKVCIFSEPQQGWDSYDFDNESKQMVKFYKKAA
jgi:hypothetical protein